MNEAADGDGEDGISNSISVDATFIGDGVVLIRVL